MGTKYNVDNNGNLTAASVTAPLTGSATAVGGIVVTGTPTATQVLTATSASTASWRDSAGGGGGTGEYRQDYVATAAQTDFVLTSPNVFIPGSGNANVYRNGLFQTIGASNDYVEVGSDTIRFNVGLALNDKVSIIVLSGGGSGGGSATYSRINATGNGVTTVFTTATYVLGNDALLVYKDGTLMTMPEDYAETSTTSVTFATPPVTGASLAFIVATAGPVKDASNLAGGSAGKVPYQTAPDTTGFTAVGTAGQVLTSAGTGTPTWTTSGITTQTRYISPARSLSTTYHNTTGKTMMVSITLIVPAGALGSFYTDSSNPPATEMADVQMGAGDQGAMMNLSAVVLPGNYYYLSLSSGTISWWVEAY